MSLSPNSTRQRLIKAALELFATQGVTDTTTRQIAEHAEVNEVTLFRQFGNKHSLLFATFEESEWLAHLGSYLVEPQHSDLHQALKIFAQQQLQALSQIPAFLRSVVGEAGQYTPEQRRALGRALAQANQFVSECLETQLPPGSVSLWNSLLLGYTLLHLTSEEHGFWESPEDFIDRAVDLFLTGRTDPAPERVVDIPPTLVHALLEKAKKSGSRDYALVYLLFATGLTASEIAGLQRTDQIVDGDQHLLHITQGAVRQVPVNQHILSKKYGSYNNNPLTQYLKNRKDISSALLLDDQGQPLSAASIRTRWQELNGTEVPSITQARQTWGVDMMLKGMTPEALSLLSGLTVEALEPYSQRVKEKIALEQARKLDR